MRKTIFLYSISLAALIGLLKFLEYRYIVRALDIEFYIGFIAVLFTTLGVWSGYKLTRRKELIINVAAKSFMQDEEMLEKLKISKRELEVLELIATGLSNQEIADKMFVSLNTVKTHLSNLFLKLEVKRRTQAIQKGKALGLIS
jgi:NarL family two-component system response regulator LiaR